MDGDPNYSGERGYYLGFDDTRKQFTSVRKFANGTYLFGAKVENNVDNTDYSTENNVDDTDYSVENNTDDTDYSGDDYNSGSDDSEYDSDYTADYDDNFSDDE